MGYTDASFSKALIHMEAGRKQLFPEDERSPNRPVLAYVVSFTFWTASAFFYALSMYAWRRAVGDTRQTFLEIVRQPFMVNFAIAAVTTPLFYYFAKRFPFERHNWVPRIPLHIAAGLVFTAMHMALRIVAYPVKNPVTGAVLEPGFDLFWRM